MTWRPVRTPNTGTRFPLVAWLSLVGLACAGTAPVPPAAEPGAPSPAALRYSAEPGDQGVRGGPQAEALAGTLARALRERGDDPRPDGKLADVAAWLLGEVASGRQTDSQSPQRMARRFGFVGPVYAGLVFPVDGPDAELWRQAISQLPGNLPINRYGVFAWPEKRAAAVVLGVVEVTLAQFAAQGPVGGGLRLRGEVAPRFRRASVHVTGPDGRVRTTSSPDRKFDVRVELSGRGTHMVEVMGDGASGPVIVVNVPVVAGAVETAAPGRRGEAGATAGPRTPEAVEQEMLALLNEARASAGLGRLAPDPELRALALGHSRDMAANNFVGHVSPTTGSFEDRARRAGLPLVMSGENVAQGDSAEAAHEGLMESPGHRANMLHPKYTHVGIAVAATPAQGTPLVATLVFGRRPALRADRLGAAEVLAAVAKLRRAKGLPPLGSDPVLRLGAEAGARAFASGSAATPEEAVAIANRVVRQETLRRRASRAAGCAHWLEILELEQLDDHRLFTERGPTKLEVGVAPKPGGAGALAVLVLTEGAGCGDR